MREGLLSVAKSPMNRVRLRNNFVRSYACMCIAQYTLGESFDLEVDGSSPNQVTKFSVVY
jgi:Phosphatidylinositol kinase and protein kinases of the PI-3 kinase family